MPKSHGDHECQQNNRMLMTRQLKPRQVTILKGLARKYEAHHRLRPGCYGRNDMASYLQDFRIEE